MDAPKEVRHLFVFAFDLTAQSLSGGKCYRCRYCNAWIASPDDMNEPELVTVCPQRERRRGDRRKRDRRGL